VDPIEKLRDEAWLGDAVLALYVRGHLLRLTDKEERHRLYRLFTSNQFLNSFGEPTSVEAQIGRLYLAQGLEAAFAHIESMMLEKFQRASLRGRR
jgi:23S rRNA maturation mini-RNase III